MVELTQSLRDEGSAVSVMVRAAMAHLNLAIALSKLGRFNDAAREFRETLRLDPENKKAQEYLGAIQTLPKREH